MKLPGFISGVGTVEFTVVALRLVKFCASKKKKVLFLMIGSADGAAELILAEVAAGDAAQRC